MYPNHHTSRRTITLWLVFSFLISTALLAGCNSLDIPQVGGPGSEPTISEAPQPVETELQQAPVVLQPSTAQPTLEPVPTETVGASPTPVPTEIPPTSVLANLPAPLLYLADGEGGRQIFRMEANGRSQTQLTDEESGVIDYDVSRIDGRLAYISGNDLIIADADGGSRKVLVDGPVPPAENDSQRPLLEMGRPRWSPDGTTIAYALNGVNVVKAAGGSPRRLLKSDPLPKPPDYKGDGPVRIYWPEAWSPDGKRLLIGFGLLPEGSGLGLLNMTNENVRLFEADQTLTCCHPVWSSDNVTVFYANPYVGMIPPGMWKVDVPQGKTTTLLKSDITKGPFNLAGFVHPVGGDRLNYFYAKSDTPPEGMVKLMPVQAPVNKPNSITPLREDSWMIAEALWTPDGQGVVIIDLEQVDGSQPLGRMIYIHMDESEPVDLPANGFFLKWGK